MVGLPPETSRPLASNFDKVAGSSLPSEALVGVISQPPSGSRTLILPVEPKVRAREKSDKPASQIASRACVSSLMAASSSGHGERAREEVLAPEIAGLQRHLHLPAVAPDRAHERHAGGDFRPEPESVHPEPVDRRS